MEFRYHIFSLHQVIFKCKWTGRDQRRRHQSRHESEVSNTATARELCWLWFRSLLPFCFQAGPFPQHAAVQMLLLSSWCLEPHHEHYWSLLQIPACLQQHCLRHFHRYRTIQVICAVYGPHAQTGRDSSFSEEGQLQCDFSYSPFATPGGRRETRGGRGDDERELSTLLRQTLEASVQVNARPLAQHYYLYLPYSVQLLSKRIRLSSCIQGFD